MKCQRCPRPAEEILHYGGWMATPFCMGCADNVMYEVSLTVPSSEGREGYTRWRAEAGLPPTRWPR